MGEGIPISSISNQHPINSWDNAFGKDAPDYAPDEIIVKFKPEVNFSQIKKILSKHGISKTEKLLKVEPRRAFPPLLNLYKLKVSGQSLARIIELLKKEPYVEYADLNYRAQPLDLIPNDPYFNLQWGLWEIKAPQAWDIETGQPFITVAIIDLGINHSHPDLNANLWHNPGEIPNDNLDNDQNGFIDDVIGWDFRENDNDPSGDNHGTMVTGVCGAVSNNSLGIAGTNWFSKIMPLRIYWSNEVVNALIYAADNGARVINMSFGFPYEITYISNALEYAYSQGAVLVAATGNDASDTLSFPASHPKVIAVGASDYNDNRAGFSNYGKNLSFLAPGISIYTTTGNNSYDIASGTSLAAPIVSGLAALLLSKNPALTNLEVYEILKQSADDLQPPGWDFYTGWGRINAFQALSLQDLALYPEARIFAPVPNSLFPSNTNIVIYGKATSSNFDHYIIEWGRGNNPTQWEISGLILENDGKTPIEDGKLGQATFNFSDIVTIRLRVFDQSGRFSTSSTFIQVENSINQGWSINLQDTLKDLAVGDVDGDGYEDLFITGNNRLYGLTSKGTTLAGWPINKQLGAITLGDIDYDTNQEIIGPIWNPSAGDHDFYIWQNNASLYPGWPALLNEEKDESCYLPASVTYLSQNQFLSIIQGTQFWTQLAGQIYIWDYTGTNLMGWPKATGRVVAQAVGDIDHDGFEEIITAQYPPKSVGIYKYDGASYPGWPVSLQDYPQKVILGNLDNEGNDEIIAADEYKLYLFDAQGNGLTGWPKDLSVSDLALADFNSDGQLEIVAAAQQIHLWDRFGNYLPGWPQGQNCGRVLLGDVNGDGTIDIISFGSNYLYGWSFDGNPLPGFPKIINGITDAALGDFNKDGQIDIITISNNGAVYYLPLGFNYNPQKIVWPIAYHDSRRTSNYHSDIFPPKIIHSPVASVEVATNIPIRAEIIDNTSVRSAKLFYKRTNSSNYQSILMNNVTENFWEGNIPSSETTLQGINYYIVAHDLYLNSTILPLGTPNVNFQITVLDTTPPTISHTPISTAFDNQPLTISAQVTDNSNELSYVNLYYQTPSSPTWELVPMSYQAGLFTGTIPAQQVTVAGLRYYIEAADSSHNLSTSPAQAPNNFYEVSVQDITPPTIQHTPITSSGYGEDLVVFAEVTDNVQVDTVNLYFRSAGDWQNLPMSNINSTYSATIPASSISLSGLDYYLEAQDTSQNLATAPNGAPNVTYHVSVIDDLPPRIKHTPLEEIEFGEDLKIEVEIQDETPTLSSAQICSAAGCTELLPVFENIYEGLVPAEIIRSFAQETPNGYSFSYYFQAEDLSGNLAKSPDFQIKLTDYHPPVISHQQEQDSAWEGNLLKIKARVTDNHKVKEVWLNCKRADQSEGWQTNAMSEEGTYAGSCDISTLSNPIGINYRISAVDYFGNSSTSPSYFVPITAIEDTTPPQIAHEPVKSTLEKVDLLISAKVTDDSSGVASVDLIYRHKTKYGWKKLPLVAQGEIFSATIPAEEVIEGEIEYQLTAEDKKGNKSQTPSYTINVIGYRPSGGCGCSIVR